MARRKNADLSDLKIYTFDFETDPFKFNRVPMPFCVGLIDSDNMNDFEHCWGDAETVCAWIVDKIKKAPPGSIFYAHNGGKFDFHYILDECEGEIMVIGARIVCAKLGPNEIRDSYSLLPFALSKYQKKSIDYEKMEKKVREKHRDEIVEYMAYDCIYLWQLVTGFIREFGLHITAPGAAIKELTEVHPIDRIGSEIHDKKYRDYYFGGRVECFQKGILPGNWKVYDVNSMYPHVMKEFEHPVSAEMISYTGRHAVTALEICDFAKIVATSRGALPFREKDGSLSFPHDTKTFFATGHEIRAAMELGLLEIHHVDIAYYAVEHEKFDVFVDKFYNARLQAKKVGDEMRVLFYKLILNSAYGKLAQDPRDFRDWKIEKDCCGGDGWIEEHTFPNGWIIYSRPTTRPHFTQRWNIAGAASITGAARSVLLRGIHAAKNPIYCDTDSIICEDLPLTKSETELGAWKLEGVGDFAAIAGKKMYALLDNNKAVKFASKGIRATPDEIVRLAKGEQISYEIQAPAFRLGRGPYQEVKTKSGKDARFIQRKARMT